MGDDKISSRDADELEACFNAHARDLFGYACVVARGDRALAEDLVQAAFEAAGRAWWSLRCLDEDRRRGWLRATLANIAVSGFRRDAAFRPRLSRIEARYRKTAADTAEQAFSSIVLQRCWQIIQSLPERQHAVALLRWQQDNRSRSVLRHRVVVDRLAPKLAPAMPTSEREEIIRLERSALVSALRALPPRQREALVLRYYTDLSEAQIAATMGISRGAVKSHTARATSALRAELHRADE